MPIREYIFQGMARAATTTDAFNAVAEPRRRQILDLLASGERPVNDLVGLLGMSQPLVAKQLRAPRGAAAGAAPPPPRRAPRGRRGGPARNVPAAGVQAPQGAPGGGGGRGARRGAA